MKPALSFLFLLIAATTIAQKFIPDRFGHISDPKFAALIKERGYQLVGTMDSIEASKIVSGNNMPLVMIARVARDNHWMYLDWNGVEYADEKAVRRMSKMPEPSDFERPILVSDADYYDRGFSEPVMIENSNRSEPYTTFWKADKKGCMVNGDTVLQAQFESINGQRVNDKLQLYAKKDGLVGVYDDKGNQLIPHVWESIQPSGSKNPNVSLIVTLNGKKGVIAQSGKVTVSPEYPDLHWNSTGQYFTVRDATRRLQGVIDTTGQLIVPPVYNQVSLPEGSKCFIVTIKYRNRDKIGAIDMQGKLVLDTVYTSCEAFAPGVFRVGKPHWNIYDRTDYGLFDTRTGTFILPCEYQIPNTEYSFQKDDYYVVYKEFGEVPSARSRWGFTDSTNFYGLLDKAGNIVIAPKYSDMVVMEGSKLLIIAENGKYGVTDMQLNKIVPCIYEDLREIWGRARNAYPEGTLVFRKDDKEGLMSLDQKILLPAVHMTLSPQSYGIVYTDRIGPFTPGIIRDGATPFGVIDLNQKELLPAQTTGSLEDDDGGILRIDLPRNVRLYKDLYGNATPWFRDTGR